MKNNVLLILVGILLFNGLAGYSKESKKPTLKETLSAAKVQKKEFNLSENLNITKDMTSDLKKLQELIKVKAPKNIFVEHWLVEDKGNEKLLKTLKKAAKKHKATLFLVVGANMWVGDRGIEKTLTVFKKYEKQIDGIVLRTEPNRTSVWERGPELAAQLLNLQLDAYDGIKFEMMKKDKLLLAEYPFWFSDYTGPKGLNYSEDVCKYTDGIIFLIDSEERLEEYEIPWNKVGCNYFIDYGVRASRLKTDERINYYHKIITERLKFKDNFKGFIVDSNSKLKL